VSAAVPAPAAAPAAAATWWSTLARNGLTIVQLALAVVVVRLYDIEGETFRKVMYLVAGGFVVNMLLPLAWRLRFFVALSLAGLFWVFGVADGAWMLGLGLVLIAACHLPVSFKVRVLVLLVLAAGFAALRAGVTTVPWTGAIWPILGSMFMFRLALYLRALKTAPAERGVAGTLAYFFMLPNLAFPLFPVIDYQTFHRTSYDKDESAIYRTGMTWVARGLLHLVLYRVVYYNFMIDPVDVENLGGLAQFMLGTFLLYLRVSGQFHLITGLLHLFGFRIPETHKLYYLAHNFVELWRRINIYWTDFMMKTVFYPVYFKVKKWPPARALAFSTACVFFVTWLLHSYQWFWLRGGFPMTPQDTLFWALLGAFVIFGALRELKQGKAKPQKGGWHLRLGLHAGVTFLIFCFLWSLWSVESIGQWVWMLGAATVFDWQGAGLIALAFVVVTAFGGRDWEASRPKNPEDGHFLFRPWVRATVSLVFLIVIAQPAVHALAPAKTGAVIAGLRNTGLNARDAALQHRGYYEQLDVRGALNARVQDQLGGARHDWRDPASAGILNERKDLIDRDLVPSHSVDWNGNRFSTNSFGMRDREYALEKPPGTLRIALLGPSHVMGNGVGDGETFEQLVEDRLNREARSGRWQRYEILNFGVDGFTLPQQLALLDERVWKFQPDVVIVTQYHRTRTMTERYILKLLRKGVAVPPGEFHDLLTGAGLLPALDGNLPIPFESWRRAASALGLKPRMPADEAAARAHHVADEVNEWTIAQIAASARAHQVPLIALGLNVVIDDAPAEVPNHADFEQANVPLIDLFDAFPAGQRPALRVTPWDDHPNAAGHRLIADRLYPALVAELEKLPNKVE
jgi:D-alanyl-lipoteichoic acid acyltransferase DltB (MBOAT superfamily)